MADRSVVTCADCYFRRAGLCALPTETPCPTFRPVARGALCSAQPPRMILRSVPAFAQHAAA
jgi:hypothetical protein